MPQLTKKAQVLFTDQQYEALLAIAAEEEKSLGALLRDAAERVYLSEKRRHEKAAAVAGLLALEETEVPEDYQDWEREYLNDRVRGHG